MSDPLAPSPALLTGKCMCGSVTYEIFTPPVAAGLCHCDRCRPQSGNFFSTVLFVARDGYRSSGETKDFVDIGTSGLTVLRRGCAACGSPLLTVAESTPTIYFVKAGGLDQTDSIKPVLEMFVKRRVACISPFPGAMQFEANPTL